MTENVFSESIQFDDPKFLRELLGEFDSNLKLIEQEMQIVIKVGQDKLTVLGEFDDVKDTVALLKDLYILAGKQKYIDPKDLSYAIKLTKSHTGIQLSNIIDEVVVTTAMGKTIRAKTLGQKRYLDSIAENDIVFGIGPAGTGKTYLAMAMAVKAFKEKVVNRIIITRPAVEAGESLGFLPGDLQNKVDPYLRPIYDALFEILGFETYSRYVEKGLIEVAPLAYMRGRTLDNAFIVLDEAQNTTNEQMKMFLTRLGYGSKAIITGDITQIDLPRGKKSGLINVIRILGNIRGIEIINLTKHDIVRHKLVQRIIEAYDKYEKRIESNEEREKA